MDSLILSSATVGIVISLLAYEIGLVSAAGSSEEKYRSDPNRSFFRSSGESWICPCNDSAFWTGSQTVCDHAA